MTRQWSAAGVAMIAALLGANEASAQNGLGVFDAQGTFVGLYSGSPVVQPGQAGVFAATTNRGYRVVFFNEGNTVGLFSQGETFDGRRYDGVYFSQPNCAGISYAQIVAQGPAVPIGYRGSAAVYRLTSGNLTEFWAVGHGAEAASVVAVSRRDGGTCEAITPTEPLPIFWTRLRE